MELQNKTEINIIEKTKSNILVSFKFLPNVRFHSKTTLVFFFKLKEKNERTRDSPKEGNQLYMVGVAKIQLLRDLKLFRE